MRPIQGNTGSTQGVAPLSTKDANSDQATSKADEENAVKSRRPRTRVPPSVRAKEKQVRDGKLASGAVATTTNTSVTTDLSHTAPHVGNREAGASDDAWLQRQLLWLETGVVEKQMGRIETILRSLKNENLRFDSTPVVNFAQGMQQDPANLLLKIVKTRAPADQVTRVVMTMIEMGCDPSARTDSDNTLLILAAAYGMTELVDFLLTTCPELDKHALNMHGANAAMLAQEHGHADALNLLIQAGVKLQPSNPALNFYRANIQRFGGEDAPAAYAHLSNLLDGTHLINLPDETGKTLIFHAVLNEDVQTVHFLCKQDDFPDLTRIDKSGQSALDYADKIIDKTSFDAINPVLEKLLMDTTDEL